MGFCAHIVVLATKEIACPAHDAAPLGDSIQLTGMAQRGLISEILHFSVIDYGMCREAAFLDQYDEIDILVAAKAGRVFAEDTQ